MRIYQNIWKSILSQIYEAIIDAHNLVAILNMRGICVLQTGMFSIVFAIYFFCFTSVKHLL